MDFRRTPILAALLFLAAWPLRAQLAPPTDIPDHPPRFQLDATGASSTGTSPYADYNQAPYTSMPVGKTLVLPVVVTGSGALRFSAKSDNPAIVPIIKSGYPFLNIHVVSGDYPVTSGTTTTTTHIDGTLVFALLRDMAPVTAGYISGLAQGGFYDGLQFFRIADLTNATTSGTNGFIAQAGDPSETGTGGPGFSFDNEFHPSLIFTGRGQLAMANAGFNGYAGTNGSQFFITQGAIRGLDFEHTIFGQLVQGFDVMNQIFTVPRTSGTGTTPSVPITMERVWVQRNDTDAILFVSAAGAVKGLNPARVTVTALSGTGEQAVTVGTTGTNGVPNLTPGLSLNFTTTSDKTISFNDPPIILPADNIELPLHKTASLPIRAEDLEFDFLIKNAVRLNGVFASVQAVGNVALVKPLASSLPVQQVDVGLDVHQGLVGVARNDPLDRTQAIVALGAGRLTPLPQVLTSGSGQPLSSGTLALFLDSDPRVTGSNFTAVINYGDGSPLVTGSNVAVTHAPGAGPTGFSVGLSGTGAAHTYAKDGIYPLTVTVTQAGGGVEQMRNTAVVSEGPVFAVGRTFTAPKGLADTQVASFTDHVTPNPPTSDYTATIDWGDGAVTTGSIRSAGGGQFYVEGRHQYAAGNTYPVDVSISTGARVATAWSTVKLTGVPTHQPPFAQAHLVGQIGNAGFASARSIDEEVTILNTGNLNSGPVQLKFYLSPTQSFSTSTAIPLTVGNNPTYQTVPVPPGHEIRGTVANIFIPPNVTTSGKFLVMVFLYSDPIQSHMASPNFVIDNSPLF